MILIRNYKLNYKKTNNLNFCKDYFNKLYNILMYFIISFISNFMCLDPKINLLEKFK